MMKQTFHFHPSWHQVLIPKVNYLELKFKPQSCYKLLVLVISSWRDEITAFLSVKKVNIEVEVTESH